jgi:chemotaxis signal transduction protein
VPTLEPFEPLGTRQDEAERGPRALVLTVRTERYAIGLEQVQVVLERPSVTRLPDAPPAVLGVVNVRGEVLPVLDTGAALGIAPLRAAAFAAVVETAAGRVALASGGAPRSEALGDDLGASDLPAGVARRRVGESGVVTLLDVEALGRAVGGAG